MEALLFVLVVAAVVAVVAGPLRSRARTAPGDDPRRAALEAAKEAKYREIRDAELDFRTGKMSEADWRALDRGLRAEAVAILRDLDAAPEPAAGDEAAGDEATGSLR